MNKMEKWCLSSFKRFVSVFLACVLVLGLLPVTALAEENPLSLSVRTEGPYHLNEEVIVDVAAPEGAALFFTLDGSDPTEESATVEDGMILVSSETEGTVKVRVLAAITNSESVDSFETVGVLEPSEETGVIEGGDTSEKPGAAVGGDASEEPGAAENGDASEESGVAEGGDMSEEPGAAEGGNMSEEPGAAENGDASEESGVAEGGDMSEEPGAAEGGNMSEEPGAAEGGDMFEESGAAEDSNASEEPGVPEDAAVTAWTGASDKDRTTGTLGVLSGAMAVGVGSSTEAIGYIPSFDENEGEKGDEFAGDLQEKTYYTAELDLEFMEVQSLANLEAPSISGDAIYALENFVDEGSTVELSVNTVEGAQIYYTTDESEPTFNSTLAQDGKITISVPFGDDGGIVTVKAVAVSGELTSEVTTKTISFYRQAKTENSVFSLACGDYTFFFSNINNAFAAVDDSNLSGDVTIQLLETTTESITEEGSANHRVFTENTNITSVKIDLNGNNLTLDCEATSSRGAAVTMILRLCSDKVKISDSMYSSGGSKATLTLIDGTLGDIATTGIEEFIVQDLKIVTSGEKAGKAVDVAAKSVTYKNLEIVNGSTSSSIATQANLRNGTGCEELLIENCTVISENGYGIYALGKNIEIKDTCVTAGRVGTSAYAVTLSNAEYAVIQGGTYISTGGGNAVTMTNSTLAVLDGGVFSGNLSASTSSEYLLQVKNGYYNFSRTTGNVQTIHLQKIPISEGEHAGYTLYSPLTKQEAAVTLVDGNGSPTEAAEISANVDGVSVGLDDAYATEKITYVVKCLDTFGLTEIKYQAGSGEETSVSLVDNPDFVVGDDGLTYEYSLVVPEGGYSLKFVVESTSDSGEVVASIGDKTYNSLLSAVLALSDGGTIKLEGDNEITSKTALEFKKNDVTLDLNGKTLRLDVTAQSSNLADTYCIVVSSGNLTIQDTAGNGKISFNGNDISGIKVGDNATLNIKSGLLTELSNLAAAYSITCSGTNAQVNFSGGQIDGRIHVGGQNSLLKISDNAYLRTVGYGMALVAFPGNIEITGGKIYADAQSSVGTELGVINLVSGGLNMTGGSLICEGSAPAIRVTSNGKAVEISGIAAIEAKNSSAISVEGTSIENVDATTSVTISGDAKIMGAYYAIEIENQKKEQIPSVDISGGYFSCGEGYLPISDTYYITYPNANNTGNMPDEVLNLLKNKDSAGYVSLVDPDSLKGTYIPSEGTGIDQVLEYTYQDFEGASDGSNSGLKQLLETTKTIYEAGNGEGRYPGDAWSAFTSAYELAKRLYDSNRNANQDEIDYRAAALSKAMIDLTASTDIDPSTMVDGYYYINAGLWKSDMTTPSMSNGALDSTALLLKTGSEYKLSLNFGPTYQYTVYGHLLDFFIYNGEDVNEAKVNMQRDTEDGKDTNLATEASYSNWYAGSSTSAQKTLASEVLGEDIRTDTYNLPGTVTVTLPYIGTTDDLRSYWVGMNVDAMGGYASAILMLSWGTLEAVPESEIENTLYLSSTSVDLSLHADGIRTAEVTANVLGSSGWTISCEEQIEDGQTAAGVATASVAGNTITFTAVKEGTSTFAVTASKDGADPLTKEITVTVTNDAPFAADVNVSGSTARIDISGASLSGANEGVTSTSSRITIDATSSNSQVSQAVITIDANTMTALLSALDRLGSTNPSLRFETDVGQLTLDYDVVENAAGYGQDITLEIAEIDIPDIDGLSNSDFETAYELTMSYGGRNISSLGGHVTITVPWNEDVGYAYYVDGDELSERYDMTVSGGDATWITDHFSTWALSTDRNLMDVGITEGVYSVPIVIKQADAPSRDSMANDAVGDMVVADVDEDGVTYTMFLKARIGDELGGEPLRGHLLKMWYYAPDDTSRSNPIRATVVRTYEDRDMNGDMDTFPREVEVYQEGEPNEDYYIQVSVDAMGGDSALQDALVRLDWDNALDDGGEAAREGFEDEYAIEQVIDSGASVSRSDLSDWIDNENILLVQGRDDDLTARFDTDALEDLYDQTSSSIRFVLEEVKTSKLTDEQQETASDRPVYQLKLTSSGDNITDIGDGNVEVTLPYELDDGEVADGLVIWLLDEDGTHSKIKCSYSERGKTVSFDTTEFGVFVIGYDAEQIWENPFTDVKEDDWFYEAVKYVVQKGLFAGTSETTFEPNLAMTRGMLVTVLYRLEGTPAVTGSSTFADVAPGQYYTSAVIWATQNGIVSGYGNGYFGTNDIVSREQMATILFRYAKSKDYDTSLVKDIGGFTDSDQVASYAKRALQWAYANGIIGGTSETTLSPKGSATRSQVATILMRFDEKIIVPAQEKAAKEAAEAEK